MVSMPGYREVEREGPVTARSRREGTTRRMMGDEKEAYINGWRMTRLLGVVYNPTL